MPERSHAPFFLVNRTLNPLLKLILRTPAHRLISRWLTLITVTGRKTGRQFTIPVIYRRQDGGIAIDVAWPERKLWWRNLRGGAPVKLLLRGRQQTGQAEATGSIKDGVRVEVTLERAADHQPAASYAANLGRSSARAAA